MYMAEIIDVNSSPPEKTPKTTYLTVVKWTKRIQIGFALLLGILIALT